MQKLDDQDMGYTAGTALSQPGTSVCDQNLVALLTSCNELLKTGDYSALIDLIYQTYESDDSNLDEINARSMCRLVLYILNYMADYP